MNQQNNSTHTERNLFKIIVAALLYIQTVTGAQEKEQELTVTMHMKLKHPTRPKAINIGVKFPPVEPDDQPQPEFMSTNHPLLIEALVAYGLSKEEAAKQATFAANLQRADYEARKKKAASAALDTKPTPAKNANTASATPSSANNH